MKYTNRYLYLFLLVIITGTLQPLKAQETITEQLTIHTNKSYYITGDLLSYKVYLPSVFKDKRKAIRACFMKSDKSLIHESFLTINEKNSGNSTFVIPVDLSSGMYHLILSSYHKERDKEIILAEVFVPIYSDLKEDLNTLQESVSNENIFVPSSKINMEINLDNSNPRIGNTLNATINVDDTNGNSVSSDASVTILDKAQQIKGYHTIHSFPSIDSETVDGLSEEIYLNGYIKSNLNNEVKKFPVIAIYSTSENKFSYLQTNDLGRFSYTSKDYDGIKNVQFINYDEEQINITITKPEVSSTSPPLVVTEEILAYLDWSRKRRKIAQVFKIASPEIKEQQTSWQKSEIKNSQKYTIDNYESFPDISTLFTEVISPLRIKKLDDGSYKASVFNRQDGFRGFFEGTPIFIIDGLITKDASYVNGLDLNQIESINIIADLPTLRKSYGPIGQSGVIYINTTLPEVRLPNNEMDNILNLNGYRSVNLVMNTTLSNNVAPNFDTNIYWEPSLETNKNGELNFQFNHTDDRGEFIIEVVSRSEDGHISKSTKIYRVAK